MTPPVQGLENLGYQHGSLKADLGSFPFARIFGREYAKGVRILDIAKDVNRMCVTTESPNRYQISSPLFEHSLFEISSRFLSMSRRPTAFLEAPPKIPLANEINGRASSG